MDEPRLWYCIQCLCCISNVDDSRHMNGLEVVRAFTSHDNLKMDLASVHNPSRPGGGNQKRIMLP
jgi:hypothetical protein